MDKCKFKLIRKRGLVFISMFLILSLGSCQKEQFNPELSEELQGKWLEKSVSDDVVLFEKVSSLNENSSGIEFKANGDFVNKSDKVWIGIPFLTYYNFDGKWQKFSENKYTINTILNGVERNFQLEIISLNNSQLEAKFVFSNSLKGIWVYQSESEGVITYKQSVNFNDDLPGIEFKDNGVFIQRANSGFCGTPPISYTNYSGHWEEAVENFYLIEVPYWGGIQNYTIQLVSLIEDELKVKFIYPQN